MPRRWPNWIPVILGVLIIGGVIFSFWYQTQMEAASVIPPLTENGFEKPCVIGGCSSQLCGEEGDNLMSTCEALPEYECYKDAKCERQENGECGWTMDEKLEKCLDEKRMQKM